MKTITVDNNPFEEGMVFQNARKVAEFLDLKDKNHPQVALNYLSHYCEYERFPDYTIIITNVFDEVVPFRIKGYKYDIGQVINVNTGSYVIIDRYIGKDLYRNSNSNWYKCRCLIDDYEFELPESRISFGIGCPLCGNRKLIPGIRTLYDVHPEVLKYMVNPEEAKILTPNSGKYVLCRCPECGSYKEVIVDNLVRFGFSCGCCSDGISYPNKFVRCFLKQIGIYFISEKSFEWSNQKLYDQYLVDYNMIIENHGLQHYEEVKHFYSSLENQKQNDLLKKDLANKNGISKYVVLDCRESSMEWIKHSIMSSELPLVLGFSEEDIDWEECHRYSVTNQLIFDICEAWKLNYNISDLAIKFNMDKHTISDYLEKGAMCGYCDFEKNNDLKNGRQFIRQAHTKPIYCITDNIYFFSKNECEEYYKLLGDSKFDGYGLYSYINSKKIYHNKQFVYVSKYEYNYNFDNNNDFVYGERYLDKYVNKEV